MDNISIEDYLKKRGYIVNTISGKRVMIKGFTCVFIGKTFIEVWHDIPKTNKSVFLNENIFTELSVTLDYMERI